MTSEVEVRYHKLLTFRFGDKTMKLKIRSTTTQECIEEAIRNRFGIPDDADLIAVDFEGCDVILFCWPCRILHSSAQAVQVFSVDYTIGTSYLDRS
eukprot:g57590.t1